ncbi:MAG: glycerophosphoryl diester phosphodiesterase [Phycisphaerales bacterium]|nr:glycerophosphoryl diester phosphodiesterase [Phycisphaerales bacterium]
MRSHLFAVMCLALGMPAVTSAADPRPEAAPAPSAAAKPAAVEVVGHRGESHDAPENTLASYNLAWSRHDPACELDVHLTKDGKLIVSHDPDTKRTAGTKVVIKDATVDELKKLDVGSWKDPKFAGERLPTLDEALATIPPGGRFFLEVKIGPEAVPELAKCIERSGRKPEQLPIISFNLESCRAAKAALPKHPVYFLASFKQDKATKKWAPTADELIAKAKDAKLDGLDVEAAKSPVVDAAFVKAVRAAGMGLYTWTIDDPARAKELAALGVDGITTNRAAWLREQLGAEK